MPADVATELLEGSFLGLRLNMSVPLPMVSVHGDAMRPAMRPGSRFEKPVAAIGFAFALHSRAGFILYSFHATSFRSTRSAMTNCRLSHLPELRRYRRISGSL